MYYTHHFLKWHKLHLINYYVLLGHACAVIRNRKQLERKKNTTKIFLFIIELVNIKNKIISIMSSLCKVIQVKQMWNKYEVLCKKKIKNIKCIKKLKLMLLCCSVFYVQLLFCICIITLFIDTTCMWNKWWKGEKRTLKTFFKTVDDWNHLIWLMSMFSWAP